MKIDFIVISVILVTLVIFPFFLIPLLQKRENSKLQKKFCEESQRNGLKTDLQGSWNQNLIGIDPLQFKLLFVQKISDRFRTELVDLREMRSAKLLVTEHKPAGSGKNDTILQRVDLEFTHLYSDEKRILNFFDLDLTYTQDLEVKNAEKWQQQIQKLLSSRPVLKKSA